MSIHEYFLHCCNTPVLQNNNTPLNFTRLPDTHLFLLILVVYKYFRGNFLSSFYSMLYYYDL